ncbi:MAG: large conductance mechanosensitive channel protein MscL [Bergeyella sp.]|nr:large conductance mechanosensitive channel protein MscL [Bergeyella sp.]
MKFFKEFQEFTFKGNVLDLAIGVIIGAAFGKIVSSIVDDIITPLILNPFLKAARVENVSKLKWNGIAYGNFLSAVLTFFCIAFVLFVIINLVNKMRKKEAATAATPSQQEVLLAEIRDLLKNK